MKWFASAPSNIALIKYMGKENSALNIPSNASLSYTLNHLCCAVELELAENGEDRWELLSQESLQEIMSKQFAVANLCDSLHPNLTTQSLSDNSVFSSHTFSLSLPEQKRFLQHLTLLKEYFNCTQTFIIRSAINFPTGCGLASSAASFAALTLCAAQAMDKQSTNITTLAGLSRRGSGSSCRSFFSPWAIWRGEETEEIALPYSDLIHHTIVITTEKKAISSSQAHRLVKTSALFQGRPERAENRLTTLINAFNEKNWADIYKICWQEFWDMHALFETADQPFGYLLPQSIKVLNLLREYWLNNQDGPLVTMDAGPNIHLLFRADQIKDIENIKKALLPEYQIL